MPHLNRINQRTLDEVTEAIQKMPFEISPDGFIQMRLFLKKYGSSRFHFLRRKPIQLDSNKETIHSSTWNILENTPEWMKQDKEIYLFIQQKFFRISQRIPESTSPNLVVVDSVPNIRYTDI